MMSIYEYSVGPIFRYLYMGQPVFGVCASALSDQCLCYSLIGNYHSKIDTHKLYISNQSL